MKTKSIKVNAVLSGIKQCCSVLFPLITIPIVSRSLGTENYGRINFGNSIVSYFVLLAALGVTAYAIREGAKLREDRKAFQSFANEVFTINMITTLFSYIALALVLIFWDKVESYRLLILIQASPIFFTTLGTDWNNNIFEDFVSITIRYIIIHGIAVVLVLLFVNDRQDYYIYAGITAFSSIMGNIANSFYIRKNYIKVSITRKLNIKKHLPPMLYLFANALATTIYVNSDITLLTLLKDNAVSGIYSISVKIYTIVKQVIQAVIGVVLPRLCAYLGQGRQDDYNRLLNKVLHAILLIILPGSTGLFMISKDVITVIAGSEYVIGYISLRILAIGIIFAVLSYFFTYSVMIPHGLEKYCLISTVISAVVNISLNFIMIPLFSLNGAAVTTVLSEAIVVAMNIFFSKGLYKLDLNIKKLFPCIIGCIGITIICHGISGLDLGSLGIVGLSLVFSGIFYAGTLIVFKDEMVVSMLKLLRKHHSSI